MLSAFVTADSNVNVEINEMVFTKQSTTVLSKAICKLIYKAL